MIKLIKLLLQFLQYSKFVKAKEIIDIFATLSDGDTISYNEAKKWNKLKKNKAKKELEKLNKKSIIKELVSLESKLSKALNSIRKLERELVNAPSRAINKLVSKLDIKQLRKLSNMLSANNEGIQTFLASSWIVWAIFVPTTPNQMFGTLTIKLKHGSSANPSGIYTFPLNGHPHGYGALVPRYVYEALKSSASAGTTFWDVFYRRWYNYHRGIHYNLLPYDNNWKKARQYTNYRKSK